MTPTNTCLDAETLAAWIDGGLDKSTAAMAEAHVSSCPRCQEIAGLIVKTTPVSVAAGTWWLGWRTQAAWLIPVTAGVAAIGLWMIVPQRPATEDLKSTLAVNQPAAPEPRAVAPEPPAVKQESAASEKQAPAAPATREAPTFRAEAPGERRRDERSNVAADAAAPIAPAAAPPPPPAATPAAPSAPAPATLGRVAEQSARQALAKAATKEAISPDGSLRWRITTRGTLEKSTDGGASWETVDTYIGDAFVSVEAPEARTAVVRTVDGKTFRTTDGGTTWALIP